MNVGTSSEWQRIRKECTAAGISGSADFGKFVNNTTHLDPSTFDERAAMSTLLRLLPTVTDAQVAGTIAAHLHRPWVRPQGFDALYVAFQRWAIEDWSAGWTLGDSLANAADATRVEALLGIAADVRFARARQMIVHSLWRFKKDDAIKPVLVALLDDPEVAIHAAGALRRVIGNASALRALEEARSRTTSAIVASHLDREIKKARIAAS